MKILVIGGTGTVGSSVVRELRSRDVAVHVLTRNLSRVASLPRGVKAVIGDLLDPATVRSVFHGMDCVFMANGVSTTETHEGLMAVNGARSAGVGCFVYLSVQHLEQAPHLPHFGSKLAIEAAIRGAGFLHTTLRANNFFQNDFLFKDALLRHGVYPQPIGSLGVSRVDVRDIGEAAAIALTEHGHAGRTYNLVGPHAHTGHGTAAIWGGALKRRIVYAGDDLQAWEAAALASMPAWMAFDFKLMFKHFQEEGFEARRSDVELLTNLLGHAPRDFDSFAMETAHAWAARAVAH